MIMLTKSGGYRMRSATIRMKCVVPLAPHTSTSFHHSQKAAQATQHLCVVARHILRPSVFVKMINLVGFFFLASVLVTRGSRRLNRSKSISVLARSHGRKRKPIRDLFHV
ncbi:unnamed protein product [Ixodes pacificus]